MRQNHLSPALLCGVAAAVPAACAAQQGAGGRESGRPNIVYIMTDDHAYQTVGAYGHPISRLAPTPNIDRLAREGMLFREAFVENSISAPSRATLLTGVYSHRHGQTTLSSALWIRRWCNSPNCSGRGLPDGDLRQMAPERRTQGLRSLRPAVGIRGVLQSGDAHARNRGMVRPSGGITPPTSLRPRFGVARRGAGTTTRLSA